MSINKESITLWFICGVIIFALSILVGYLAEYSQKKIVAFCSKNKR